MVSEKTNASILERFQNSLERTTGAFFYKYGKLAGTHPWIFLLTPILLSIICGCGFMNFGEINDIFKQFTPVNSPAYREEKFMHSFWRFEDIGDHEPTTTTSTTTVATPTTTDGPEDKTPPQVIHLPVVIEMKDGTSLLNLTVDGVHPVISFLDYLEYDLNVTIDNKTWTHRDMCRAWCGYNNPVRLFLRSYNAESVRSSPNVKLSHPSMEMFNVPVYLAHHVYGTHKNDDGEVDFVSMIRVVLILYRNDTNKEAIRDFQWALHDYVTQVNHSQFELYTMFGLLLSNDIQQTGRASLPYFALSTPIVLCFTVLSTLRSDCARSKPWEALAGVFGPLMAIFISFGSLIFFGLNYQPIVTISLFLILSIGVDDIYIMLHGWHKSDPKASVPERLAQSMRHSGPSITITSITNACSFGIGIFTPTPAIKTFCKFTCAAIIADYFCQVTYFPAIMAFGGRREAENKNSCLCCMKQKSQLTLEPVVKLGKFYNKFLVFVTDCMCSWWIKVLVLFIMLPYWGVVVYGWTTMKADLSAERVVMPDSLMHKWGIIEKRYFEAESNEVVIIVGNPGHFADLARQDLAFELVEEFENLPFYTKDSTFFWLPPYLRYLSFFGRPFSYEFLPTYLTTSNHAQWRRDLNYDHGSCIRNGTCLRRFKFHVDYHDLLNWPTRIEMIEKWRGIVEMPKYATFNASIYYTRSFLADQVSSIGPITYTNVLITMCCMCLVCVLFVPSIMSIICAISAVMSINVGVFGLLMLWDVDLDPISMAGLLMSVGFSVDYTAHITYHYNNNDLKDPKAKLLHAYQSVAWPETQAAISTLLIGPVLALNQSYLVTTFVKTVFLVITLGWFHGMVVLPVVLTSLTQLFQFIAKSRKKSVISDHELKKPEQNVKTVS